MALQFVKAEKHQIKARFAIDGPAGAGKTYTALVAAQVLAKGGKIAVIDTENRSASLYADRFSFDVLELDKFDPRLYVEAIDAAEQAGYAVIVIDSLSPAWEGEGGVLELHEQATKRQRVENSYTAWRDVTPIHRKLVDKILRSKCHIVATMRSKMEYVQEKDSNNKTVIKKVGLAPIQRQGMEYEFTVVADMDVDHTLVVSKSRCEFLADAVVSKPTADFFKKFSDWLEEGSPEPVAETSKEPEGEKAKEPDDAIVVWNDTKKSAQELLSPKAAESFMKRFVTTKDNPGEHLFNSKQYLVNHLRAHLHADKLTEITYEKAMAMLRHMKGEGDDPRWYKKEEPKEAVEPENSQEVETYGVNLDTLARVWTGNDSLGYSDLRVAEKERISDMLTLVKIGQVAPGDYPKMVEYLDMG